MKLLLKQNIFLSEFQKGNNMSFIVLYKTKYGATKAYAEYIAEKLGCNCLDAKKVKIEEIESYDKIIYGGGLYAEVINGVGLITKNIAKLAGKKIAVFTTAITPLDCRTYYEGEVLEKNFKDGVPENIRIFNFMGKMKNDELSAVHRAALVTLKKIMRSKKNPTDLEKMLIELCDFDDDLINLSDADALIEYIRNI